MLLALLHPSSVIKWPNIQMSPWCHLISTDDEGEKKKFFWIGFCREVRLPVIMQLKEHHKQKGQ